MENMINDQINLDENDVRIVRRSLASYENKEASVSDDEWLATFLKEELPDHDEHEHVADAREMVAAKKLLEEKRESLKNSISRGESKSGWLQRQLMDGCRMQSDNEMAELLTTIDKTITESNKSMRDTILRLDGQVNQNPNLDGFIAEAEHANTFNMDSALQGKPEVKAVALEPGPGQTYGKNSVDIIIKDHGKTVRRYQAKYGLDSKRTQKLFEKGDYRGQQKLIPEEQEIDSKHTTKLEYDGVESRATSKKQVKSMQNEAQSKGEIHSKTWDDFSLKQLAKGIGKQSAKAGVYGAGLGALLSVGTQLNNEGTIDGKKVAKDALKTGAAAGATTALAGAIKVILEKQSKLPPGSPGPTVPVPSKLPLPPGVDNYVPVAIASMAIASISTFNRLGSGEITTIEAMNELEETGMATVGGLAGAKHGAILGSRIGKVFGPKGVAVCGFVGGVVGGVAGSTAGRMIAKGATIVREKAVNLAKAAAVKVKEVASTAMNAVSDAWDWLTS